MYCQELWQLEIIEHIPRMPWCLGSIEHAQDSLVQACSVVSIGVSDVGVATIGNKKALFVTLVDHILGFEAY
jgi:regulation of enolase protein 1 (concanavalin A-like superfamily)